MGCVAWAARCGRPWVEWGDERGGSASSPRVGRLALARVAGDGASQSRRAFRVAQPATQMQMTRPTLALLSLLVTGASAWGTCQKFSEIYTNGEDMIERMWNNAFKYTADEQMAYTMWWYEGGTAGAADGHDNPNDLITQNLGKTVPDQVHCCAPAQSPAAQSPLATGLAADPALRFLCGCRAAVPPELLSQGGPNAGGGRLHRMPPVARKRVLPDRDGGDAREDEDGLRRRLPLGSLRQALSGL